MKPWKGLGVLAMAILVIVSAKPDDATYPRTSDVFNISCIMQEDAPTTKHPCVYPVKIPERFNVLLRDMETLETLREAAAVNSMAALNPATVASLPLLILLHLSAWFLSTANPLALSAVVRRHPANAVLVQSVLSAMDQWDDEKRNRFIRDLGVNTNLGTEVQQAIGVAALRWWGVEMDRRYHTKDLAAAGTPLLAALPPGFLADLPTDRASLYLEDLRGHRWLEPNDVSWATKQPVETKRVWMMMFKNSGISQFTDPDAEGLKMLWAGATPDEIDELTYPIEERKILFKLKPLTKLQVRSFMARLFHKPALSSADMNEVFDWMLSLSPAGLQRFSVNDTDFSNLPAAYLGDASLPTLKQVLEQVVANGVIQGRIENPESVATWNQNLKDVGRLAFLIESREFKPYTWKRLDVDVLAAIDTYALSTLQARYLTNYGKFLDLDMPISKLKGIHGLFRAIPTAKLGMLRISSVSEKVLTHLVEALPSVTIGRTCALFNHLRASLKEPRVLEPILRNPSPGQYLSTVSAREIDDVRPALEVSYKIIRAQPQGRSTGIFNVGPWVDVNLPRPEFIDEHLHLVPAGTLAAILGSARRELLTSSLGNRGVVWNMDTLLAPVPDRPLIRGALLGLSCPDVMAMDLVDFPYIMATFNVRRKAAGLRFPKRIHHCLQRAMEDYLYVKREFRRTPQLHVIKVLEPSDIEAFGGYLLSTLRPGHIRQSDHGEMILTSIGTLSASEMLSAVPDVKRLREYAMQLVDYHKARNQIRAHTLFSLGNLFMFLPASAIVAIEPAAWKVFVEAKAGLPQSLAVCSGSEERDAWHRLAVKAFGSVAKWSAATVAAQGDMLAVLPNEVAMTIRTASWRDAADILIDRTVYHDLTDVRGVDITKPFVDACRSAIPEEEEAMYYWGVRRTVRYYLRASQLLLDTVVPADRLVRRIQQRSSRTMDVDASKRDPTKKSPTTTTTETASTTDPFGDFEAFLSEKPDWMKSFSGPETVILRDDESAAESPTTAPSDSTTTAFTSTASDVSDGDHEGQLMEWSEAVDTMNMLKSSNMSWAASNSSSTVTPDLTLYPNQSDEMSSVMKLGSLPSDEAGKDTQDAAVFEDAVTLRRSKRNSTTDKMMELQVGRDVQVQVTCQGVRSLGKAAPLALVKDDGERMLDEELLECIEELGTIELGDALTAEFWNKLRRLVRNDVVGDLGRLVSAMTPDDVPHLNLSLSHDSVLDTLSIISQHVRKEAVLKAVAKELQEQNDDLLDVAALPDGEDSPMRIVATAETLLASLGPTVCHLPEEIRRTMLSRRGAMLHAVPAVQAVHGPCHHECLPELVQALMGEDALGPVSTWTAEDVHYLGLLVAGLTPDELSQLKKPMQDVEQPLAGLTANSIACMDVSHLNAIGDHMHLLTPVAASAVNYLQDHQLNDAQKTALNRVRYLVFHRQLGDPLPGENETIRGEESSAVLTTVPYIPGILVATLLFLVVGAARL